MMCQQRIIAAEYAELAKYEMRTAYETFQSASKKLYQRSITFYEPAYTRKGKSISSTEVKMRWDRQKHYQKDEGWVELYWCPKLVPYLTNIKKQFINLNRSQRFILSIHGVY
ncbi:replication initiation protein [Bartonella sp. AP58NXGY]|uniref:replication initiation protein n=1 Tax=Bartonella sp. AP58NXGY TaxID=3243498 RepID=UPI0035CEB5C8